MDVDPFSDINGYSNSYTDPNLDSLAEPYLASYPYADIYSDTASNSHIYAHSESDPFTDTHTYV